MGSAVLAITVYVVTLLVPSMLVLFASNLSQKRKATLMTKAIVETKKAVGSVMTRNVAAGAALA